jgi:predicted amidohydrolase YtcJ
VGRFRGASKRGGVWIGAFCLLALTTGSAQVAVNTVMLHGKIWTENPRQPEAEALAIADGTIVAVGTSAQIARMAGPKTRVVELRGRRVVPGFNDAHVHFMEGGFGLASVQLRDAASPQEMRQRIADYAKKTPTGEWISGGDWDQERWTPSTLPSHELIDGVTLNNPVFLERLDGHMGLANAVAMQIAGVNKTTPDVPGGEIGRDAEGNPTGIFKDEAMKLILRVIPPLSTLAMERAVAAAEKYASENGVTSVQDMWGIDAVAPAADKLRVYEAFMQQGLLQVRISQHQPLKDWKKLADVGIQADFGNTYLHIGGLKDFADGSLGSRTAWLLAPYADAPPGSEAPSGLPRERLKDSQIMYTDLVGADKAGLQIAVHAIGDQANREILNLYERLERENGPRDRRLRIEHAQTLSPQDLPRFARLQVIASMQPLHLADDGNWAEKRLGPVRIQEMYDFKSLLDSGAVLAFGSDWPVAPMKPLQGIYAAVTRRTRDGKNPGGWVPTQKISVAQAVHAYTMGAAYAEFEDDIKGSIETGKLADIVVLDEDIFHASADELAKARVDMTIVGGKVVYERQRD